MLLRRGDFFLFPVFCHGLQYQLHIDFADIAVFIEPETLHLRRGQLPADPGLLCQPADRQTQVDASQARFFQCLLAGDRDFLPHVHSQRHEIIQAGLLLGGIPDDGYLRVVFLLVQIAAHLHMLPPALGLIHHLLQVFGLLFQIADILLCLLPVCLEFRDLDYRPVLHRLFGDQDPDARLPFVRRFA